MIDGIVFERKISPVLLKNLRMNASEVESHHKKISIFITTNKGNVGTYGRKFIRDSKHFAFLNFNFEFGLK